MCLRVKFYPPDPAALREEITRLDLTAAGGGAGGVVRDGWMDDSDISLGCFEQESCHAVTLVAASVICSAFPLEERFVSLMMDSF